MGIGQGAKTVNAGSTTEELIGRTIRRFVADENAVEDLIQEAWMRVAQHAGGYQGNSAWSTWVYAVSRNAAISYLRRRQREQEAPTDAPMMLDGGPEVVVLLQERRVLLVKAMKGVSEKARVLLLLSQAEIPCEVIGWMLSMPKASVNSALSRARSSIREALQEC
jgi:RNA polymerase sigma-70 factor (ECF subfamily)